MLDKQEIVINTTPLLSLIAATGSLDVLQILSLKILETERQRSEDF